MIEYPQWPNFDEWFNVKKGNCMRAGQRFAYSDGTGTIHIGVAAKDWIVEHQSNIRTEEPTYKPLPTEGGTLILAEIKPFGVPNVLRVLSLINGEGWWMEEECRIVEEEEIRRWIEIPDKIGDMESYGHAQQIIY